MARRARGERGSLAQAARGRRLTLDVPVGAAILRERLQNGGAAVLIRPAEANDAVDVIEVGAVAVRDHAQARLHTVPPKLHTQHMHGGVRRVPGRCRARGARTRVALGPPAHLCHVLAVVAEQVRLVEKRHIDVVQLDQLKGRALLRVEEELLVIMVPPELQAIRAVVACAQREGDGAQTTGNSAPHSARGAPHLCTHAQLSRPARQRPTLHQAQPRGQRQGCEPPHPSTLPNSAQTQSLFRGFVGMTSRTLFFFLLFLFRDTMATAIIASARNKPRLLTQ